METPHYLQLSVVEKAGFGLETPIRAMVNVDQVAGIAEVPRHSFGGKCRIELKWTSEDDGKSGQLLRNAYFVVEETYEQLSGLLAAHGVLLKPARGTRAKR